MSNITEGGQVEVSDQFTGLLKFALDHGIELIKDKGALIPFTISVVKGEITITAIPMAPVEAVESAKRSVAGLASDTETYAIVFIGDVLLSGQPYQAVVVEGAERGLPHGFRIGQPFEAKGSPPKLELIGEAVNLGLCEQLMA
jgi:hypothetical protein